MWRKKVFIGAIISVFVLTLATVSFAETQKNSVATNLGLFGSYTWDIAVDPTDNSNVYLATYYSPNGFFYSNDGGTTWNGLPEKADHGAGRDVEVNPTTGTVYALLNDLLISTDGGATYTTNEQFGSGGSDMLYAQSALYVAANDAVFKSTDDGTTFSETTVCSSQTIWSLASYSSDMYAICNNYSTSTTTLYKSSDAGSTWTNMDVAADGVSGAETVEVNPTTGYVYLIPSSTGGSTYYSTDAGDTWTELSTAPLTGNMAFDSTGRIYVGWYYSDDNGANWSTFGDTGDYNHIIFVDPTNDNILYDTSTPGFSKSTDRGTTWTDSVENITGVEVTSVYQATDKDYVWVATQNGPAFTANFTADEPTWAYSTINNFTSSGYDAVWVKPSDPNKVVYSSSMALSYSINGGTDWSASTVDVTLTGAVFQFATGSDGTLYGVFGPNTSAGSQTGGVIKSTDDGATWTSMSFPSDGAVRSITVASDGDIFVGAHLSTKGVYKYDGTSWSKLTAPDDYEYIAVLADPDAADTIYALATGSTAQEGTGFYKSTDDGVTWNKKNSGLGGSTNYTEFNSLAVQTSTNPNTLYLSGVQNSTTKGVIYKSADGGKSWDRYYTGKKGETFNALLFDGLIAGNSRGLFDMKSRASLTLKANKKKIKSGNKVKLTLTLKDKATKKKLKKQNVKLYKKVGKKKKFKFFKTIKTNKKGKKILRVKVNKKTRLYAKWRPKKNKAEEYTIANSKTKTVKLK